MARVNASPRSIQESQVGPGDQHIMFFRKVHWAPSSTARIGGLFLYNDVSPPSLRLGPGLDCPD
ncbi:hypothetical protein N7454_009540 [Penicillium verhagenii]|nr:hypothetical protein N7454_009540 [Penicillium verhagenii]